MFNLFGPKPRFTENWYDKKQIKDLKKVAGKIKSLKGNVIEIGCWEGRSTIALAGVLYPDTIYAVDTWQGNIAEGEDHPSVVSARERDVYNRFLDNMKAATKGNVKAIRQDCFEFLKTNELARDVKFCHIDAAHDYDSVKKTIELLLPYVVPGGCLCGDDFGSAHMGREDLNGGVEKAVRELLPGFGHHGDLWYWYKEEA